MAKTAHSLSWEHKHSRSWLGKCRCGWRSIPSTSRQAITKMYRTHVDIETRRRRRTAGPQPVTPVDQLPAVLRP